MFANKTRNRILYGRDFLFMKIYLILIPWQVALSILPHKI